MKSKFLEILTIIILVGLLILLSNPFMFWMSEAVVMIGLLLVTAIVCVFAGFVMREKIADERDALHRMNASRAAYLSGLAILTIAFVLQGLTHSIDPSISLALGVMIVVKFGARIYFDRYK